MSRAAHDADVPGWRPGAADLGVSARMVKVMMGGEHKEQRHALGFGSAHCCIGIGWIHHSTDLAGFVDNKVHVVVAKGLEDRHAKVRADVERYADRRGLHG